MADTRILPPAARDLRGGRDGASEANGAAGAIEPHEEAIARGVNLPPVAAGDLGANDIAVAEQQRARGIVPQALRRFRRSDHVGEHDGQQRALRCDLE